MLQTKVLKSTTIEMCPCYLVCIPTVRNSLKPSTRLPSPQQKRKQLSNYHTVFTWNIDSALCDTWLLFEVHLKCVSAFCMHGDKRCMLGGFLANGNQHKACLLDTACSICHYDLLKAFTVAFCVSKQAVLQDRTADTGNVVI